MTEESPATSAEASSGALRPVAARAPLLPQAMLAVFVFLLALLPRSTGLATFVTTDEVFWVGRAGSFAQAVDRGQFTGTFQTGHPGVPTMWAGFVGMGPSRAEAFASPRREVSRREVSRNPDFIGALAAGRWAVALTTALATALLALLAWQLFGGGVAFLAGSLIGLDPFYLAHSKLLHIDALQTTFMSVSLLAALVHWRPGRRGARSSLLLSAAACGLAMLAKSPGSFMLGFVPLIALASGWRRSAWRTAAFWRELLLWAAVSLATYALVWPAMWVAPLETLRGVYEFILGNTSPEHSGGPWVYLATLALRTTPLVWIGLLLLLLPCRWLRLDPHPASDRESWRAEGPRPRAEAAREARFPLLVVVAFVALFGLAMAVSAKSFDRYLLPIFPSLDLLAAVGLARFGGRLRWVGGAGSLLGLTVALPLAIWPVAIVAPYHLAWYNPLAGGGAAAVRMLAVGWGEGLDQVAGVLNLKPNPAGLKVGMSGEIYTSVLGAQFRGQVIPLQRDVVRGQAAGDPSVADFFLTYVRTERDGAPPLYDLRFQTWQPELVVRLGDVEYARLYSSSSGVPVGASFGGAAVLEGYGVDNLIVRAGRGVSVHLFWRGAGSSADDCRAVVELSDAAGRSLAAVRQVLDVEPGRARDRSSSLTIPLGTPPGEYLLWVGLECADGAAIPLSSSPASLAPGAPERPTRAVLRSIVVR
ncbi:MAG: phospholipid carrier-dependent glycosyltransferase [Chloroflexi bacterium]|nr:phospholipid carrier-dependent glycosyltransferase [Chloroflexota bacterium]